MSDPSFETVSASQVPALFGYSPWETRFMLYQQFIGAEQPERDSQSMWWGRALQGPILERAGLDLGLTFVNNDRYYRHPTLPVGATADGYAIDPDGLLLWVEAKNWDKFGWQDQWTETTAPLHIEMQHQTQLMVPHPDHGKAFYGYIMCLVGGNELKLYRRDHEPAVQEQIAAEAQRFLGEVEAHEPPPVAGKPIEIPTLMALYPELDETKVVTVEPEDFDSIQLVREYLYWQESGAMAEKMQAMLKTKLLALGQNAARIVTPLHTVKLTRFSVKAATVDREPFDATRITVKAIEGATMPDLPPPVTTLEAG